MCPAKRRVEAPEAPEGTPQTSETPDDSARSRILAAAIDVFAEHGYSGTATREICRRAGVNGAALNYHWRSKEQLWQAVCEASSSRFTSVIAAVDFARPPRDVISDFMGALFDALVLDPRPIRIVAWAALQAEVMDYDGAARLFRPLVELGNGYVKHQQSIGRIPEGIDVEVVVPLVQGMLVYTFLNRAGLERYFEVGFSDPAHAARFRTAIVTTTLRLLGLDQAPAEPTRRRGGGPAGSKRSAKTTGDKPRTPRRKRSGG